MAEDTISGLGQLLHWSNSPSDTYSYLISGDYINPCWGSCFQGRAGQTERVWRTITKVERRKWAGTRAWIFSFCSRLCFTELMTDQWLCVKCPDSLRVIQQFPLYIYISVSASLLVSVELIFSVELIEHALIITVYDKPIKHWKNNGMHAQMKLCLKGTFSKLVWFIRVFIKCL